MNRKFVSTGLIIYYTVYFIAIFIDTEGYPFVLYIYFEKDVLLEDLLTVLNPSER